MPWCLGLFLRTDRDVVDEFLATDVSVAHEEFWHSTVRKCATSTVCLLMFLSFSTCGYISIILYCWCSMYEFLCNKFTLYVQTIIYWRNLKDAFFSFCEVCKEFLLQCTEMNKHWKLVYCCKLLYFQREESHRWTFGNKGWLFLSPYMTTSRKLKINVVYVEHRSKKFYFIWMYYNILFTTGFSLRKLRRRRNNVIPYLLRGKKVLSNGLWVWFSKVGVGESRLQQERHVLVLILP